MVCKGSIWICVFDYVVLQVAGEVFYTGIADAFRVIFKHEGGIRALYRGIVPTMVGMAPYAGMFFIFNWLYWSKDSIF